MMAICNGELFGDGLYIHPGAMIHDGKLNITLLKKIGLVDYIRNLSNLKKGIHIDHPEATYFTTQHLSIQDIEGNASMECDGEAVEEVNVSVEVIHNKIRLLGYTA
jgi:diacylglycerol kinase (ATP)